MAQVMSPIVAHDRPILLNHCTFALGFAWSWLLLGALAWLCIPALRGVHPLVGWMPFWLLAAPLIDLAVLRWQWLAATARMILAHTRRRRRATARQARKLRGRRGRHNPPQPLPIALNREFAT